MKRLHNCVVCGDSLPTGSRIDRQYCRESCRILAYRKRRRGQPDSSSCPASNRRVDRMDGPAALARRLAREEREHAATRNALAAAQARIAELEHAIRQQDTTHRSRGKTQAVAVDVDAPKGVDLEARLHTAMQRAAHAEQLQAETQRRLGDVEEELQRQRAAARKLQEQLAHPHNPAAGQHVQQGQPPQQHINESVAPPYPPEPSLSRRAESGLRVPAGIEGTPRAALPWEIPDNKPPYGLVCKWMLIEEKKREQHIEQIDEVVNVLPAHLDEKGKPLLAQQILDWMGAERSLMRELGRELSWRIIGTDPSARETDSQIADLVDLTLRDSFATIKKNYPKLDAELDTFFHKHPKKLNRLARYLVEAWKGTRLRE